MSTPRIASLRATLVWVKAPGLNIFNPGAFTHTSVALRDAILGVDIPLIEIHISNIFNREAFREKSYFSDIAVGIISGFGEHGYKAALELAINRF